MHTSVILVTYGLFSLQSRKLGETVGSGRPLPYFGPSKTLAQDQKWSLPWGCFLCTNALGFCGFFVPVKGKKGRTGKTSKAKDKGT
jgi:hypothetical protein